MDNGDYIKSLRESKEMSQRELASLIGVSNTELYRIENGSRKEPSLKILKAIGNTLGVNYLKLFFMYGYIEEDLLNGTVVLKDDKPPLSSFSSQELLLELLSREQTRGI